MVGHSSSSEPTSSRGKDYPMTASFSKGGDASATMQFPFDEQTLAERLADVEQGLYNVQAYNRVLFTDKEESIQSFGRDLFHALFSGRIYKLFETVRQGLDKKNGERLLIRLRIHPPELAVLPWELMYDNDHDHPSYLCLDRSISLVRYQELRNPYTPLQVELPLYILG